MSQLAQDKWDGSIGQEESHSIWYPHWQASAEIAELYNIPISTVKKVAKLYKNFLASGGKDEDFDIQRKVHKRCSDTKR